MVKIVLNILVVILLVGCSVHNKISRKYERNGREVVLSEFGEPHKIIEMKDGNQLFIYVKESFIRETEIGTGGFTMDKRISPAFIKEETYRFLIDANGVVSKATYEKKIK